MAKVVIGMSGGVDSTVAALLLKEQGHDVLGVFLRLWRHTTEPEEEVIEAQINRLQQAAEQINVPFRVVDARKVFRERVVQYFINGYREGITPNPCFFCNRELKWVELLAVAANEGYLYAASGHYARVERDEAGKAHLFRGVDSLKDQSYVLASLKQEQLKKIILPLGSMTKAEVRGIAEINHLRIAASGESQDICFLPDGNYAGFLEEIGAEGSEGEIFDVDQGAVVGKHRGLAFYTIGQRKGLGVYAPEPRYVIDKDIAGNRLIVGKASALGCSKMIVNELNWITDTPGFPLACETEIRYHSQAYASTVETVDGTTVTVTFNKPIRDITPGQAAVFYIGQEVIGSGIITKSEHVGGFA